MRQSVLSLPLALTVALGACLAMPASAVAQRETVYFEDFESVVLGPSVDEFPPPFPDPAWTHTPPSDKNTWNRSDLLDGPQGIGVLHPSVNSASEGVQEWEGWAFVNPAFWVSADDQRRSEFTGVSASLGNVIAVADPDEWDDRGDPEALGSFNAFLDTNVSVNPGVAADLSFDSSWREEDFQVAELKATYFDGSTQLGSETLLRWESAGAADDGLGGLGPNFKPDATNELVTVGLGNENFATADNVNIEFSLIESGNDWWWAVDNISVDDSTGNLFFEDWEGAAGDLQAPVQEVPPGPPAGLDISAVWSEDAASIGFEIDESGVPGAGNPAEDGVTEWAGFAFTRSDFWVAADGQGRQDWLAATGEANQFAVADPDEWDDAFHVATDASGDPFYDTFLTTPLIDITGVEEGTLELTFDASWRDEAFDDLGGTNNQTAIVEVSFDGGPFTEILRWESDPNSPDFFDDRGGDPNGPLITTFLDDVLRQLNNPAGASTVQLRFGLIDAANDWWFAVDNITLTGVGGSVVEPRPIPEPTSLALLGLGAAGLAAGRRRKSA